VKVRKADGYKPTREAAMPAFAKSWRRSARCANARPLAKQSGDRDYNTCKEPADAAEHQNIVGFGHGVPRKAPARASRGSKSMRLRSSPARGCQMTFQLYATSVSALLRASKNLVSSRLPILRDRRPAIGPPCQRRGRGGKEKAPRATALCGRGRTSP
jgi:hypothetical protein